MSNWEETRMGDYKVPFPQPVKQELNLCEKISTARAKAKLAHIVPKFGEPVMKQETFFGTYGEHSFKLDAMKWASGASGIDVKFTNFPAPEFYDDIVKIIIDEFLFIHPEYDEQ